MAANDLMPTTGNISIAQYRVIKEVVAYESNTDFVPVRLGVEISRPKCEKDLSRLLAGATAILKISY